LEDVVKLSELLKNKFNIDNKVYLDRKKYPIIKITLNSEKEKFYFLIKDYIHPDLKYKIDNIRSIYI
jgi:hypothetical protein